MNLPNKLTVSRFVLTAAFLAVIFARFPGNESIALALFVLASISDFLDGRIARSRKLITNFGILMDPLADKILTCSAFIAFVELRQMEAWMVVVVVALQEEAEHPFLFLPSVCLKHPGCLRLSF